LTKLDWVFVVAKIYLFFSFFFKGSRDNMSIVIVTFPGAPKMVPEEVEKDNICNEKIENRIKGNINEIN